MAGAASAGGARQPPALPGSKGHEFWKRDFTGSSGLFSFVLNKRLTDAELAEYLDNFSLFSMAYSWGGFESLILANQPEQIATSVRMRKSISAAR
jgi:cystathionine beta-lyase